MRMYVCMHAYVCISVCVCNFLLQRCQPCEPIRKQNPNSSAIWLDSKVLTLAFICYRDLEKHRSYCIGQLLNSTWLHMTPKHQLHGYCTRHPSINYTTTAHGIQASTTRLLHMTPKHQLHDYCTWHPSINYTTTAHDTQASTTRLLHMAPKHQTAGVWHRG